MPFVKLDCGMLNSTIWIDLPARTAFITALLMAEPREFSNPIPQINTRNLELTGWSAPPGWYGFVPASGSGIIRRAELDIEIGLSALERLGSPEHESRSLEFDGRRMIRCNGGYLILNYQKYREKDYTAAERSKRYRERKAKNHASHRDNHASHRDITQAEAEAEADKIKSGGKAAPIIPSQRNGLPKTERDSWDLRRWREAREGLNPQPGTDYCFLKGEERRKADLTLDRQAALICGISIERLQELLRPFYPGDSYIDDLKVSIPLFEKEKK